MIERILVTIALIFVAVLVWAYVGIYFSMKLDKKCLEAGYSGANLTYDYEGFCIKRDQYGATVVVKEKDVK